MSGEGRPALVVVEFDSPIEALDAVAEAMEKASVPHREGPFGLYDYTDYGDPVPHHVRDFRDMRSATWGMAVHRGTDPVEARRIYDELTRRHVADAAVRAWKEASATS